MGGEKIGPASFPSAGRIEYVLLYYHHHLGLGLGCVCGGVWARDVENNPDTHERTSDERGMASAMANTLTPTIPPVLPATRNL